MMDIEYLLSDDHEKCLIGVSSLKNLVIGSNKQKDAVMQLGVLPRLLQIMNQNYNEELLYEVGATLCSLTKGKENNTKMMVEMGTISIIIKILINPNFRSNEHLMDIMLRTLRSLFLNEGSPTHAIYENYDGISLIQHLLEILSSSQSWSVQEAIINILGHCCLNSEQQNIMCNQGVVEVAAPLLSSNVYKVQLAVLFFISQVTYQNEAVSAVVVNARCDGKTVPDVLEEMMSQDKETAMQLAAGKCMTYMCRTGALNPKDRRIVYKTLPTLCRLCRKELPAKIKSSAADVLAFLTEVDTDLQKTASICDHIILSLAEFFKCQISLASSSPNRAVVETSDVCGQLANARKQEQELCVELKQSAFKAFASLGANDEEIRKKIIETDMLMDHIVSGLSDGNNKVRLAALRCLHSLSRSVQQLRTTFQDHAVWVPLRNLLHSAPDDALTVASSTLCNLLLEFSPTKQHFLDRSAVELLCNLTKREEPALRLNGVWALMNMTFQTDQAVKLQVLSSLGTDQIFRLLTDSDAQIVLKTLGLIRNLLSNKPHIDHIMNIHGKHMVHAVTMILDGDNSSDIKEQALCILANIADGETAKEYLMSNEELLKKLTSYMMHGSVKLQIAATFCISNLIWNEEDGALERQIKLKEMGVQKILQQLLTTCDTTLFDKVKTALQHFS